MTYAAGERAQPGPAGTKEAAQTAGGESGLGRIPAGLQFDQFGPVYLAPMQSGAAAPRVQSDPSASLVMIAQLDAADAPSVGGAFCEWWQ